jgi:hypothetical protein
VCFGSRKINLSTVFAGQNVGVKEVEEKVWLISFMHYDLGFFDHETTRFECAMSPFAGLPMSSAYQEKTLQEGANLSRRQLLLAQSPSSSLR